MSAEPRVGGYVTYRKPGQPARKALISWIYADGSMRVQPVIGRTTTIQPVDVERGKLRKGQHVGRAAR